MRMKIRGPQFFNILRAHKIPASVHVSQQTSRHPRLRPVLLVLILFARVVVTAQDTSHCQPPPAFEKEIAAHPSAAAYDALGAHYASQSRFACAISAFESAIRLDPNSWQGHYNLGLAFMSSGNTKKAVDEFRTALNYNA